MVSGINGHISKLDRGLLAKDEVQVALTSGLPVGYLKII